MADTQDYLNEIEDVEVTYSTFWQRFFAMLIDGLVLSPLIVLDSYNTSNWKNYLLFFLLFLVMMAYKPFMEAKYGATLGKMALQLTVVDTAYQKASINHILRRNIFDIIDRILAGIVAAMAFAGLEVEQSGALDAFTGIMATATVSFWVSISTTVVVLVDTVFLISDSRRRALHDRIGQTYVIQK